VALTKGSRPAQSPHPRFLLVPLWQILNHGGQFARTTTSPRVETGDYSRQDGSTTESSATKDERPIRPPPAPTPITHFRAESVASSGSVRHVEPEDTFYDGGYAQQQRVRPQSYHELKSIDAPKRTRSSNGLFSPLWTSESSNFKYPHATVSGSEELADNRRMTRNQSKITQKPIMQDLCCSCWEALHSRRLFSRWTSEENRKVSRHTVLRAGYTETEDNRIVSGSEAAWTDEDAF